MMLLACGGKSGGGDPAPPPPPPPPAPTAATLKTPAQNSECLDGENVEFSWNASENTDSYTIVVKKLIDYISDFSDNHIYICNNQIRSRSTILLVYNFFI